MVPIVLIVGESDSGKTFLVEQVVSKLTAKGYRIATIKHNAHGFDIDRKGKDSWRHKQAGASTVILSAPDQIAVIKDLKEEQSLDEIQRLWIRDADLIVAEGYKGADSPKIEVSLFKDSSELVCSQDERLVAVVSNKELSLDVPIFQEAEIDRLVKWLEERFINQYQEPKVEIFLSGKPVSLTPFLQKLIRNTLRGFLSALKGWDPQGLVEIKISAEALERIQKDESK